MYLKANSFDCLRGRISIPLTGTWVADLAIDPGTSDALIPPYQSPVTITLGENGFTLTGNVRRINNAFDTVFARVVGGGLGIWQSVNPQAYQNATFGVIASQILSQVGETLSTSTPSSVTNLQVPFWTVMKGPAFKVLYALVKLASSMLSVKINWRVLSDGTVYIGPEIWPLATMTSYDLMSWQPEQLLTTVFSLNPTVLPGQNWQGGNVSNVEHVIEPERIRTRIWFLNP